MKTLRAQTFRLWLLCCVLLKLMWCDCVDCVAFKCLYFFFLIFNVYLVYEFIIYIYSRHYFFRPLAQSRMLYKHCTKQGMTATASNQSQRCWARRPHFPAETERRILWVRQWIMWPVWQSADFLDKLKHEVPDSRYLLFLRQLGKRCACWPVHRRPILDDFVGRCLVRRCACLCATVRPMLRKAQIPLGSTRLDTFDVSSPCILAVSS